MTEQPSPALKALAGIEFALRDAVTRVKKPSMSVALALGFFQAVARLARCMRQCRKVAGLPREWPLELVALLESAVDAANARLSDPSVTDDQALRLNLASEGLSRARVLALSVAEKPQKIAKKLQPSPVAPQPATNPAPPAPPRRSFDEYAGIGALAVRLQNIPTTPEAMMAEAVRNAIGRSAAPTQPHSIFATPRKP